MAHPVEMKIPIGETVKENSNNSDKGFKSGLNNVLEGLGIGAGMKLMQSLVSSFKPLISMIEGLFKMVTMILLPISGLIVGLLMPVLIILKPIALAINQIMLPFLQQGIKVMQESENKGAGIAAGFGIILSGLNAVFLLILGEISKLIFTLLLTVVAEVLGVIPLFGDSAKNFILNDLLPNINEMIDVGVASGIGFISIGVVNASKQLGVSSEAFRSNVVSAIGKVFPSLSDEFRLGLASALNITAEDGSPAGIATLALATKTAITNIWAEESFNAIDSAWTKILSLFGGNIVLSDKAGFVEKVGYFFKKIVEPITDVEEDVKLARSSF